MSLPSQAELTAIRERAEAATPGPWYLIGDPRTEVAADNDGDPLVVADTRFFKEQTSGRELEDAAFIAAARTDVPVLLDALAVALAVVQAARTVMDDFDAQCAGLYGGITDPGDWDTPPVAALRALLDALPFAATEPDGA